MNCQKINILDVETCLHVLTSEPLELRKTYDYILNNYGIKYLNSITSILIVPVDRIKEIEKLNLSKDVTLSAGISRFLLEEIEKIIKVCRENNIEITGSVFKQSAEEIEKSIKFIKENYGKKYLKPLIINKKAEYLKIVFEYLDSLGVLETVIKSASILTLKFDEIKERKEYLDQIGEPMVLDNGRFNSIFGLSRKKYDMLVNKKIK